MCGRFALDIPLSALANYFHVDDIVDFGPRFNIAPTQIVPAVLQDSDTGRRVLKMFGWGLVPSWAKDASIGSRLINARSETAAEKPAFRSAFRNRRCLIPTTGFYEWKRSGSAKQPYFIHLRDGGLFAFAGLWDRWKGEEDRETRETCTILTCQPNELMSSIHNRMPVILDPVDYSLWLDPGVTDKNALRPFLKPYPSERMVAYPVSTYVNKPGHDDPACIVPLE